MFEVLHPHKNELITQPEYIQLAAEHGFQLPNEYVGGRCPVCKRRMKVRAGHKKDDGHFYHNDKLFCPTKDPASRPYLGKTPTNADPVAAARNREFARNNINAIWSRLNEMVPYLDLKEFVSILEEARRINVYGYVDLDPTILPYVYVTLINFLPSKSRNKQRKFKFCFFYEAEVKDYEDLWIDRGRECHLSRISYDGNQTKRVKVFEMEREYLTRVEYPLSERQEQWVSSVC
ncbi:conserved protein of unknown function [Acidithiobacillus ferrivorans]|uniref:Uncharacterized protein n=1 Tax=Acidithiobacillus ferrivorans TaxID=160808 RepID=A0A060URK7_9PROT|nr:hypothetical protein [Acidithiobacillus ferrivorans]CDQ09423.1 conserved hypothetical protein [Acidithiobacillus ferrivorans]SMH67328.1 conserved protein of unknown function [Acidithiobacillus ferrivorans]